MKKIILDVTCGGRTIWFNKNHPRALYIDIREEEKGHVGHKNNPNHEIKPDIIMDFRKLDFPNKSFNLVVFDPPHVRNLAKTSIMYKKFGALCNHWQDELKRGFKECWRVLDDYGVLIFKWSETDIKLKEVLKVFDKEPLFGHTTGSKSKTKWMCFMKIPRTNRVSGKRRRRERCPLLEKAEPKLRCEV